jgi:PIN domain nuclease of toxin-antitoxin system
VNRLLLDTEAFIWWDANDRRLGAGARAHLRDAADVYVSAASAWEIAIKAAIGKLKTSRTATQALVDSGFSELPVTFQHAEALRDLPRHHGDPFDRLILATAHVEGLAVVTSDRSFRLYDVPLIDASR